MYTGSCFCGAVKYQVDGELVEPRSCHCSKCRKVFSAQASAYAEVNQDEFKWVQGQDNLTSYSSHEDFGLCFCKTCGSTLCGTYKGRVHGITLGCLNENPDIELKYHFYLGSKANWEKLPEGINGFRYRPHESDPEKMYYDLIMLVHYPEGAELSCERKFFDEKVRYEEVTDNTVSHIVTDVLQQDADNVSINQRGLKSDGFRGMLLGEQELRLRHFHNTLDAYLSAD